MSITSDPIWEPRSTIEPSLYSSMDVGPDGVPRAIWEILYHRGIRTSDEIKQCLSPQLKDLRDPLTIIDMPKAVERLVRAFRDSERICVYADYDLDGTSGLALLTEGLKRLGFKNVESYQPKRLSEGYGVHVPAIEELKSRGVNVVITVDVGVTAFAAAEAAAKGSMDFIVTDHHLPAETLPEAFCVVNPNRRDCTSNLGHLSGAGVAFYLVLALKRALGSRSKDAEFNTKSLLDYFLIGTLTDMVPLKRENRVLAKHGLLQLAKTKRPGFSLLLDKLALSRDGLTSQEVVLNFAPKLNALSRMEAGLLPKDFFMVEDESVAASMVQEVMKSNETRKALQKEAEALALESAHKKASAGYAFVWSPQFHKGVVGLVATKLTQKLQVPAFAACVSGEDVIMGSARVPETSQINLLEVFSGAKDILLQSGGHARAAGFSLKKERADDFDRHLQTYFAEAKSLGPRRWPYDVKVDFSEITPEFLNWYAGLEPFGSQFPVPIFYFDNVEVSKTIVMTGGHLRLEMREGGVALKGVFFNPPSEFAAASTGRLDFLARLQWNTWRGNRTLQLQIDDARWV